MENNALIVNYEAVVEKKIINGLVGLGFDFNLLGSYYLEQILLKTLNKPHCMHKLSTKMFSEVAVEYGIESTTVDKCIKRAIIRAYQEGELKDVGVFNGGVPTVKEVYFWLLDFFMFDMVL